MLPIVQRELAVAARRGSYYKIRYYAGALAGLGGLGALFWSSNVWMVSTSPGQFLFFFCAFTALIFCFGAGLFLTVDSISFERRQGTLGLLLLTELHGFDIVLGKLASAGATAISSFLTIFPIMALSVCLGGVTGAQFWRVSAALVTLLFLSLCLGLFVSSLFEKEGAGLLIFSFILLFPAVITGLELLRSVQFSTLALLLNPFYAIFVAFDFNFGPFSPPFFAPLGNVPRHLFYPALFVQVLFGFLVVVAAGFIVPVTIRKKDNHLGRLACAIMQKIRRPRKSLASHTHPVVWLSVRGKSSIILLWALILLGALSWFWDPLAPAGVTAEGLFYPLYLHYLIKLHLAFQAPKLVSQEKETGFLELLLTTPINCGILLRSKKAALRRHYLSAVLFALAVHAWFIAQNFLIDPTAPVQWVALASMIILFCDFFSISWMGLWQGLIAKNSYRAFLRTLVMALALPWLPFFLLTGVLRIIIGKDFEMPVLLFLICGFLFATIFGLASGLYGLARVHYNLRYRIAEPG